MTLLDYLPLLASEPTTSGEGVALPAGMAYAFGALPVLLTGEPEWQVRIVRPVGHPDGPMTVTETIVPSTDPQVGRTFDESHLEQANELGRFSFSTYDVDAFDIEPNDLVEFIERGLTIGGGVIRQDTDTKVSRQDEGKPYTEWSGTRPIGVLNEAPVPPARGEGSTARDRVWGWFGVTYDDSTWINSTVIGSVSAGTYPYWPAVLEDFDDALAEWIWAARRAGNPPLQEFSPTGECLFRHTFTVPAGVSEIELQVGGDDVVEVYYEGEFQFSTTQDSLKAPHEQARRRRISVVPGENLVAFAVANSEDVLDVHGPNQNPAGLVFTVFAVANGELGDVLTRSGSSTKILEYPTVRPGVTAGHVLLEVLGEVQAVGFIPWVTPTFTAAVDSNGRPWAEVGEIGTKVGYSLWKLTQQLTSVYIDTDLTPGTNEWHTWSKGTRGSGRNVVLQTTSDPDTSNLVKHVRTRTATRATDVLSYSEFGWKWYSGWDGTSRRIAATVEHGSLKSTAAVERYAAADLGEYREDRVEHDVDILPTSDVDKPYWGYGIGDTVTIDGDSEPVVEIGWRRDRQGVIWWDYDGGES